MAARFDAAVIAAWLRMTAAFAVGFIVVDVVAMTPLTYVVGFPIGHCGNGWPPPPYEMSAVIGLLVGIFEGPLALAVGAVLAEGIRRRRSTLWMAACTMSACVAGSVTLSILAETQMEYIDVQSLLAGASYTAERLMAPAGIAALVVTWWARCVRRRLHQVDQPWTRVPVLTLMGAWRVSLVVAIGFGLLVCAGVLFADADFGPPPPLHIATKGQPEFSFYDIVNHGPIFPLGATLASFVLALLAAGLASWLRARARSERRVEFSSPS
jgi:hypothetical protein